MEKQSEDTLERQLQECSWVAGGKNRLGEQMDKKIKIKKILCNPDKDILTSSISMKGMELIFEKHMDNPEQGNFQNQYICRDKDCFLGTWSHGYRINNIYLIECAPGALAILFDNFGHIHLEGKEQVESFVKSVNWIYENALKPYFNAKPIVLEKKKNRKKSDKIRPELQ
jgi:hypothetical protein